MALVAGAGYASLLNKAQILTADETSIPPTNVGGILVGMTNDTMAHLNPKAFKRLKKFIEGVQNQNAF